jgi:hypothetical protein
MIEKKQFFCFKHEEFRMSNWENIESIDFWNVILRIERNFQDISIKRDIEVLIRLFSYSDSI